MRIFKIKPFHKWAKKIGLSDKDLVHSVYEIQSGNVEANLGGSLYKKRIAIKGKGKRSGARTILSYKSNHRTIFLYAFEKNQRSNITDNEQKALKELGGFLLHLNDAEINKRLADKSLYEVRKEVM